MVAAIALVLIGQGGASQKTLTPAELYKQSAPFVATIETDKATGTAFAVDYGQVFTCYHVIEGATYAELKFADGSSAFVNGVVALDKSHDIAELSVSFPMSGKRLGLDWGDYAGTQVGDRAYVIGTPRGLSSTLTEGLVSSKRDFGDRELLQISAGVSGGSSGSPVMNAQGRVIGMVTGSFKDGQLLNFAITSKDLKATKYGIPFALLSLSASSPSTVKPFTSGWLARTDKANYHIDLYKGVEDVSIAVDALPAAFGAAFTSAECEAWAREEFESQGIVVVTTKEQSARLKPGYADTDEGEMKRIDGLMRGVTIDLNATKSDVSGLIAYNVEIEMQRAGLIGTGIFVPCGVDREAYVGFMGSAVDVRTRMKATVKDLAGKLARRIKEANPSSSR